MTSPNSNWPDNFNPSNQHHTLRFKRRADRSSPYLPPVRSGYAPGSESPPWGWPVTFLLGLAFCFAFFFGGTFLLRIILKVLLHV